MAINSPSTSRMLGKADELTCSLPDALGRPEKLGDKPARPTVSWLAITLTK